ncbi:hypothetical protein NUW54_g511 [Trametes sanguinea]|uniref:Uncharacterized protein n=1 Tax=Trametes sanguinea TaxID=158606 RepID=A0ACC1Q8Z1_9APHY|nr:hypothetical protein NUW54_g511 [Trametes sanguinea]
MATVDSASGRCNLVSRATLSSTPAHNTLRGRTLQLPWSTSDKSPAHRFKLYISLQRTPGSAITLSLQATLVAWLDKHHSSSAATVSVFSA